MSKSQKSIIGSVAILAVFFELGILAPANAYIDAGTGSYIFSVIIAVICGAGYALKTYWRRITEKISAQLNKKRTD